MPSWAVLAFCCALLGHTARSCDLPITSCDIKPYYTQRHPEHPANLKTVYLGHYGIIFLGGSETITICGRHLLACPVWSGDNATVNELDLSYVNT